MGLLTELKRRNVIRVALAWGGLTWLLIAIASLLFPALGLPLSGVRWLLLGLVVLAVPVLWLAWRFAFTGQGLRRDPGPQSLQRHGRLPFVRSYPSPAWGGGPID